MVAETEEALTNIVEAARILRDAIMKVNEDLQDSLTIRQLQILSNVTEPEPEDITYR